MAGWLLDDWLVQQDSFTFIASRMRIQERHKSLCIRNWIRRPHW
jgi:hypothetical protein